MAPIMNTFDQTKIDTTRVFISPTCSYKRDFVQGMMKKKPEKAGLFNSNLYQRYFRLNHKEQLLTISKDYDEASIKAGTYVPYADLNSVCEMSQ